MVAPMVRVFIVGRVQSRVNLAERGTGNGIRRAIGARRGSDVVHGTRAALREPRSAVDTERRRFADQSREILRPF
jgi:hypothetical protein